VSKETRNDVSLVRFLLKIHETFEVGTVFRLVCRSSERNVDVFTRHPLIEIIFDLRQGKSDVMFISPKKTYQSLDESNHRHRKLVVLGKLGVDGAIILFVLEPDLVDKSLDQRCTKDACLQCRILYTENQLWYDLRA